MGENAMDCERIDLGASHDFDLTNILKSFGISDDDAKQIDEMIDATIDLHLNLGQ